VTNGEPKPKPNSSPTPKPKPNPVRLPAAPSRFARDVDNSEQERDLFVPIFSVVAMVGFGAVYAYETIRLYLEK